MSDDRNFRYFYYEKVGFRGVEEKKSLDILLTEKPNDLLSKLSSFTHRFQLPGTYRKLIWKLLLDVAHTHSDSDDLIPNEQNFLCDDLIRGLQIMLYIEDNTLNSKLLVLMFLLEFSEIDINLERQFQRAEVKDLMAISEVFVMEFIDEKNKEESLKETYWLFRNLISSVRSNFAGLIETYERFINALAQEDQTLYCHLLKLGVIRGQTNTVISSGAKNENKCDYNLTGNRPLITWFVRFYAGIVDHNFLIKIYDRIVGALIHGHRPFAVLTSVGKAVLLLLRNDLLATNSNEQITKRLLNPLTVEQSEEVVIKAVSP